jgi:hypothetical protein
VFLLLLEMQQKLRMHILHDCLPRILSLLFTYLHPPPEADEVSRDYWLLVTASHHDSDGLILHQ